MEGAKSIFALFFFRRAKARQPQRPSRRVGDDDDRVAAVVIEEREAFCHPGLQTRRRVLVDLSDDMLAVAQPAHVREALTEDPDLAAILAREPVSQRS